MSWSDNKELSLKADVIGWNSLKKKNILNDYEKKKKKKTQLQWVHEQEKVIEIY